MRTEHVYDPVQAQVAHRIAELRHAAQRVQVVDTAKSGHWRLRRRNRNPIKENTADLT